MIVKICGLRHAEHASAAAAAGADWIGLVFAASKRRVSVAEASAIATALRERPAPPPLLAGLFVNAPPATIAAVADAVGLDLIQLSGDEPVEYADALPLPVLKAIRLTGAPAERAWIVRARREQPERAAISARKPPRVLLLVDAHVPGAYGGTGTPADWSRAAALAAETPLILAGGLHPANVARAIATVRPIGVDVSSGVETDGVKDPAKIEAFIAAVRSA
ncbi:MAG: phosphoribosylanthranilate isomerase [Chloroflexaceae bacterium]|nr:phosphoribosylanthranilate isomerase [Chloroflexaceae bacterium]